MALAAASSAPRSAAATDDAAQRLERATAALAAEQERYDQAKSAIAALNQAIDSLDRAVETDSAELERLASELPRLQVERERLEAELATVQASCARADARETARLEAIYRAGRLGSPLVLIGAGEKPLRMARYLVAVSRFDTEARNKREVSRGSLISALDLLRRKQGEVEPRREQLRAAIAEAETERSAKALELDRARKDAAAAMVGLDRLRRAHADVSAVAEREKRAAERARKAAGLGAEPDGLAAAATDAPASPALGPSPETSGASGAVANAQRPGEPQAATAGNSAAAADRTSSGSGGEAGREDSAAERGDAAGGATAQPGKAAGEDEKAGRPGFLARLFSPRSRDSQRPEPPSIPPAPATTFAGSRGKLSAPAAGRVIAQFGQMHSSGAIYSGLIVRCARGGAEVRAVFAGEVIFAGELPGLGKTLILSHGARYHSVYARLARLDYSVGDHVPNRAVVGKLADGDSDLHFEIRAEGKAVDPIPWLAGGAAAFERAAR